MKQKWIFLLLAVCVLFPAACGAQARTADTPGFIAETTPDTLRGSGNAVLNLIADSYSADAFVPGEVPGSDLALILQSGAKAPSAKNAQPWHFTVITNDDIVKELLPKAAQGCVAIAISGKTDLVTDTMAFDCGLATENMQLASEALGYGARIFLQPVGEIDSRRGEFGIPDGYEVLAALLVGAVKDPVDAIASATTRAPLSELVNFVE